MRALLLSLLLAVSCRSVGPVTVPRDRVNYSGSVAESWKQQTLLNIVKLRYMDLPVFVDIGQIVSGYSVESFAGAGVTPDGGNAVVQGRFTDRPTITYVPLTGSRYMSGLMAPIPPSALFIAIESGWPANVMLRLAATSINGLKNERVIGGYRPEEPEFARVLELLQKIHAAGSMNIRVVPGEDRHERTILTFPDRHATPEVVASIEEVRRLLGLNQEAREFSLAYAPVAAHDRQIAVITRSLFGVMSVLSSRVEVPAEQVSDGRAWRGASTEDADAFRIFCSTSKPDSAYVAIHYRDRWFWIDDHNLPAKRLFAFVMLLFSISDTDTGQRMPLLTIPTQ